jgi:hypothetical protein
LIAAFGGIARGARAPAKKTGGNRMPHDPHTRHRQIKARLEQAEKTLSATRNSAGGHSRAVLLHLERQIHASKKDLALIEVQLADGANSGHSKAQETIAISADVALLQKGAKPAR